MYFILLQIFLVVCIIGLCSGVAVKTKDATKTKTTEVKDTKEKRESSVSSGPYSYDPPQKSFTIPLHETLKTQTTYEYKPAKVQYEYVQKPAQIEVVQIPKKVSVSLPTSVEHYHQEAKQVAANQDHYSQPQVQYSYPSALESYLQALSLKNYHQQQDHSPVVYYQPSQSEHSAPQQQQNSYYYKFPTSSSTYKAPATSGYTYSYQPLHTTHVPSYNYISESQPQQQQQQVYHGYSEIPSQQQLFYPSFASELSHKPMKTPDYAIGHKGLGHYASVAALSPEFSSSYYKPQSTHEYQYFSTQTERPFRPSVHLTTPIRGYDSYSEQSIGNLKPSIEYLPPKKTYLPAKEEIAQPSKTYLPVKEQVIEFVTQPSKKYLPSKPAEYLNPQSHYHIPKQEQRQPQVEYQIQYITVPEKSYLPPSSPSAPQNTYIPPKKVQESPKNTYIPPIVVSSTTAKPMIHTTQASKHIYLPPNNPYQQQSNYQIDHMSPSIYEQYNQDEQYDNNEYQQHYSSSSHK